MMIWWESHPWKTVAFIVLLYIGPLYFFICCCSVTKSCPTLCDPMDSSMPGFPVLHYLLEFIQTHVHWLAMLSNYFTLCCSLILLPSILCSNQSFFQWVSSLHQVAKVLELQLQHFFIYSFIFKIINSHQ